MSMNVKVGQTWRYVEGHEWIVKAMITDGEEAGWWQCECTVGTQRFAVGSVKVWPLKLPHMWTLVRDVEPQVDEVWEYTDLTAGMDGMRCTVIGRSANGLGWDCKEHGPYCFSDDEITREFIRRISPAAAAPKPPEPAKPWRSDKERGPSVAIPEHIDKAMRARNDEFHERHKDRIKAALASLGSEGFTVRVPSRSWER